MILLFRLLSFVAFACTFDLVDFFLRGIVLIRRAFQYTLPFAPSRLSGKSIRSFLSLQSRTHFLFGQIVIEASL
jgi:hypothetical protein